MVKRTPGAVRKSITIGITTLSIVAGDITSEATDAITNAANGQLWLGSGIAGAIARNAGPTVEKLCRDYTRVHGAVEVGGAVVTAAGLLKCKHIIHAVGPVFRPKQDNDRLLESAILSTLRQAQELGLTSLSIPAISTGIFGFPKQRCAEIMIDTLARFLCENKPTTLRQVRMVNIDQPTVSCFEAVFERKKAALEALRQSFAENAATEGMEELKIEETKSIPAYPRPRQ